MCPRAGPHLHGTVGRDSGERSAPYAGLHLPRPGLLRVLLRQGKCARSAVRIGGHATDRKG